MLNFQVTQLYVLHLVLTHVAALTRRAGLALTKEEGQGFSEYMLVVSLMVALVVSAMGLYTTPLGALYDSLIHDFEIIFNGATL